MTQLLHTAGLFVGDDLIGAMPSNPYGHFEDRRVVAIHDSILADNGEFWQIDREFIPYIHPRRWHLMRSFVADRRANHGLWGFKDPRVCLFMEPWMHLIPDVRALVVFRDYRDSTHSLERRHARELTLRVGPIHRHRRFFEVPDLALRMWIVHNRALLRFVDARPAQSMVVSMSQVSQGFPLVDALNERWDMGLAPVPTNSLFDAGVTASRTAPIDVADEGLVKPLIG